jgi:hypothetical protein
MMCLKYLRSLLLSSKVIFIDMTFALSISQAVSRRFKSRRWRTSSGLSIALPSDADS